MRGISCIAKNRLASEEGLCYMEWVSRTFREPDLLRSSAEECTSPGVPLRAMLSLSEDWPDSCSCWTKHTLLPEVIRKVSSSRSQAQCSSRYISISVQHSTQECLILIPWTSVWAGHSSDMCGMLKTQWVDQLHNSMVSCLRSYCGFTVLYLDRRLSTYNTRQATVYLQRRFSWFHSHSPS